MAFADDVVLPYIKTAKGIIWIGTDKKYFLTIQHDTISHFLAKRYY